jgi:prepilin-type N-terminal cleavage/methylation domain-containing protein
MKKASQLNLVEKRESDGFTKKGFSLVEILFSLVILSVGILAVSVLMTRNIQNSVNSKNQIIASQLSQEGLELVKNLKQNNPTFTADVTNPHYRIEPASDYGNFLATSAVDNAFKRLYLKNGFYTHDASGTATKFYRTINVKIVTVAGKKQAEVESMVTWNAVDPMNIFPNPCTVINSCVSNAAIMPDLN